MTKLQNWFNSFEENHKNDPVFNAEAISIDMAMSIGKRLKELKINQNELAKELKVNKSYVSQILQGQNNMTILTICKIAAALNMQAAIQLKVEEGLSNQTYNNYSCVTDNNLLIIPNKEQDGIREEIAAKVITYVGNTINDYTVPQKLASAF